MSAAPQSAPLYAATPARDSSRWLFGPAADLLLGCGAGYVLLLAILCVYGAEVRGAIAPGVLAFVTVLIGAPHYGATILRVYERREDRRAYALFSIHATLLLAIAFVVATRWVWLGSLLLTVYLTWSPWHYTGQNYGLAVMFLRRRGVVVDAVTKRWVYASFLLSYGVVFLALHSHAPGAEYTPPLYIADGYRVLSLDLPRGPADVAFQGALAGYVLATGVAFARLLARGTLRAIAPMLLLAATQALWFAVPVAMRRFGLLAGLEPFAPQNAGWYFFWAALAHSIQYVWVTSYFARTNPGFPGLPAYFGKVLLAGTALWCVPALLFAPDLLGRIPYDAGLSALVASVVNLHHFVLDGAIWKLRDGRIARILVRSEAKTAAPAAPARRSPAWIGVWAIGAASLACFVIGFLETEFGLRHAFQRADVPRMRVALERLDWIGRESATNHLSFGRLLAARGEKAAALHEYERSVALRPGPEAWIAIADTYEGMGKTRAAREAIDRAVELAPDVAPLLFRAATNATRAGDEAAARALLERAVAIDPEREIYRRALERARARASSPPVEAEAAAAGSAPLPARAGR